MFSPSIKKLIELFSKFPTVGPRTAARFVFYLVRLPKEETEKLTKAISDLRERIKVCSRCLKTFEGEEKICEICQNNTRDKSLLCIVEKESDLETIENIKKYKGFYFVLGGFLSKFKKEDTKTINKEKLLERAGEPEVKEIIIALNQTTEGEATTLYLERLFKKNLPDGKRITRLGRGLPVGAELEYADEETLDSAFEGRK